ncbi:MAG: alpha/beta hydrolase [Victivallales bacterium]|nr:alpha/beta hydrolase [Victivallales bacterium]
MNEIKETNLRALLKKALRRAAMFILEIAVGLYVLLLIIAAFFSNSIIFPAPSPSYDFTSEYGKIMSADGNTIAVRELKSEASDFWILFGHGNGVDMGLISDFLERATEKLGCSIIAYDYPGYGRSTGAPSETSVISAADAVFAHLRSKGIPEDKIIIWGRSIGGGPATHLAHSHAVAALILESAFISAFRVVTKVKVLPFDKFDNLALIDSVGCPVFFIQGKRDEIIPFAHGEALYEKAKPPKSHYWLDQAGHNDIEPTGGEEYWSRLKNFLSRRD